MQTGRFTLSTGRGLAVPVSVLSLLAALAGCSSGSHPAASPSSPVAGSAAPATTTPAAPTPGPAADPLTGQGARPSGPVVVVKVDNAPSARPLQQGLSRAAVVYQELVEGGATRYMAVFTGGGHFLVGPCRSARLTDLAILSAYGRVVLGFSGANLHVLAAVHRANVADVSQSEQPQAYETHGRRPEAWNFFTSPAALRQVAGKLGGKPAAGVRDIGLRFGPDQGGRAVRRADVTFTAYSHAQFSWDAARHGWRLAQDGRPMNLADGTSVVAANVIVQFVKVTKGRYHDVLGNYSPDSATVGAGKALVFRDGHVTRARWSRPTAALGTHYLGADGHDVALRPGQSWIMLVPIGNRVATS